MRRDAGDDSYEPDLPEIEDAEFIVGYLFSAGPTVHGGNVITHSEIRAWEENSGVELEPWQVDFLRRLSSDYIAEFAAASDADREPPWKHRPDPSLAASSLKRSIRRLANL